MLLRLLETLHVIFARLPLVIECKDYSPNLYSHSISPKDQDVQLGISRPDKGLKLNSHVIYGTPINYWRSITHWKM